MAEHAIKPMTPEEFLAWQKGRDERYELVEGIPVKMMSGASNFHDVIVVNIVASLHAQLRGKPCRVASADSAVKTRINSFRRPDAAVTCDPPRPGSYEAEAPRLVVEVLSDSNTGVLWQRKLEEYRRREGLAYILLVDSELVSATLFSREGTSWKATDFDRLADAIDLPEIGCTLSMAEMYERLDLPGPTISQT